MRLEAMLFHRPAAKKKKSGRRDISTLKAELKLREQTKQTKSIHARQKAIQRRAARRHSARAARWKIQSDDGCRARAEKLIARRQKGVRALHQT